MNPTAGVVLSRFDNFLEKDKKISIASLNRSNYFLKEKPSGFNKRSSLSRKSDALRRMSLYEQELDLDRFVMDIEKENMAF